MERKELTMLRVISNEPKPSPGSQRASVEIYRPFFLAGLTCVLTVGCLLGSIAMLGIGKAASYTGAAWVPYIRAHANSQLFGWVGLFVIGFALQQHPPTVAKKKLFHQLAWVTLSLMAVGIALRFVAEPLVDVNRSVWMPIGIASGVLEALAVIIFLFNTTYTRYRSGQEIEWQSWFVFGSLFWLLACAVATPFVFYFTHQAQTMDSILFIATWYPVLRDAQFLGFVIMMIFGVSLVKLNSCFGARQPIAMLGKAGYFLWSIGLILHMLGWLQAFNAGFTPGSQRLYILGGILLTVGAIVVIVASRIFERLSFYLRSQKFVRAAFFWLFVAGVMIVLEPLNLAHLGVPFSHAYTGAIRHALTVGFISQMIIGISTHVISVMNDLDESKLSNLWTVFWLINIGNGLRVAMEAASDYSHAIFLPMGFTGFIELTGLTIWAFHVAKPMTARRRQGAAA